MGTPTLRVLGVAEFAIMGPPFESDFPLDTLFEIVPPLLRALGLTLGMGLLLGLGLREYYLSRPPAIRVGSTRTVMLAAILGFSLWVLEPKGLAYAAGLLMLGAWLALFYQRKLAHQENGVLGMLFIVLGYALGPLTQMTPAWFVVATGISALFVLNSRDKLAYLTEHMASQEVVTLAKFLVLSAVILPLTPRGPISDALPVSLHQTWLSVVVISSISYVSYLAQTYFFRGKGILLTGAIGGLYSSTATSLVIARQSTQSEHDSKSYAAAIILATGMMYVRLLMLVGIFDIDAAITLVVPCLGLFFLMIGVAIWINHQDHLKVASVPLLKVRSNPLEFEAAALFAGSFLVITGLTHALLHAFPAHGLLDMALISGLTDIDPFVMAVVNGHLEQSREMLAAAVLLAAASNGIMKGIYVAVLGSRTTRRIASRFLWVTAVVTLGLAFWISGPR